MLHLYWIYENGSLCKGSRLLFLLRQFLPFLSPDPIDMPFKITIIDQFCQHILHKGGNGAGIKSQILPKYLGKVLGKHHIANTQRRGNGLGEGIQIDDTVVFGQSKQGLRRLGGNGEFRFKIVLNDVPISLFRPADIFVPLGGCGGNTTGITAVGSGV